MKHIFIALLLLSFVGCTKESSHSPSNSSDSGVGGSMASLTIIDNTLYTINGGKIESYDISNPHDMQHISSTNTNYELETLFPYADSLLFVGSQSAMLVYQHTGNTPQFLSQVSHIAACDPVVFDGSYAYVTLNSSSTFCWRGANELQIINLKNIYSPKLEKTYPLSSPKGLGVDDDLLFVCDANSLIVYDKTNPLQLVRIATFDALQAYDVIPYKNNLIVSAAKGVQQYKYDAAKKTITQLSTIAIKPKSKLK